MNKKNTRQISMQAAKDSHLDWLEQAKLLVDGGPIGSVQEPIDCSECQFGLWFYSEGESLFSPLLFDEIERVHKDFHDLYAIIYEDTQRIINPKAIRDFEEQYSELKVYSALLVKKLDEVEKAENERVIDSSESRMPTNGYKKPQDMDLLNTYKLEIDLESNMQHLDLIKLDCQQIEEEIELTKLELKQIVNRKNLTLKSVNQLEKYKELKKNEVIERLLECEKLENKNTFSIETGFETLDVIKGKIKLRVDELDQFKLVDQKLKQRKTEELRKEQKIRDDFEQQQYIDKEDLIQLRQQKEQWQLEIDNLNKQVALIEQDIERITKREKTKNDILHQSDLRKDKLLQELREESQQREMLIGHKSKIKEIKHDELKKLEQEKCFKEEELSQLDVEADSLRNEILRLTNISEEEIELLKEKQLVKKKAIEKLDNEKSEKHHALKELAKKKQSLENFLKEHNEVDLIQQDVAEG